MPEERRKIIAQAKPDTSLSPAKIQKQPARTEKDIATVITQRLEQRMYSLQQIRDRQKPQTVSALEVKARQTAFSEMQTLSEDSSEYEMIQKKIGLQNIAEGKKPAYIKSVDVPILPSEKKIMMRSGHALKRWQKR